MLSSIYKGMINLGLIVRNYRGMKRVRMLATAARIWAKCLLRSKSSRERFLGLTVSFFHYKDFRSLFNEMFVRKEYAFASETQSPVIIDCGSNIGMSVLFFKQLYPRARITAFEPDPDTFAKLQQNINDNAPDVRALPFALGEKKGTLTLYRPNKELGSLGMTTVASMLKHEAAAEKLSVQVVPLSDYIKEPVDLLKIDIEGAEVSVLKDLAAKDKFKLIKHMIVEFHYSPQHTTNTFSAFFKLLEEHHFSVVVESLHIMPPYDSYRGKGFHCIVSAYRNVSRN